MFICDFFSYKKDFEGCTKSCSAIFSEGLCMILVFFFLLLIATYWCSFGFDIDLQPKLMNEKFWCLSNVFLLIPMNDS
jgi:hypothetical protein